MSRSKPDQPALKDNGAFCILPWIHMHIWPNGSVYPCCMSDTDQGLGNINDMPIDEVINSAEFKILRKQMLNGEKPDMCTRCFELEDTADTWTLRKSSLETFKHYLPLAEETQEDGTIDDFKMRYMDIRFSNLCNMKCRTCGPELSSKWHDDQIKLFPGYERPKFIDVNSADDFMGKLKPHLDTVEEVYFAGGEVLITPQHYEVLDYWLERNRDDVRLRYTTNFSNLRHKKRSMLEYWKLFKDVRVAASLDTFGERAEYSRSGTNWQEIVANRKEMIESCPNTYFELTPTISIFSVYNLFEFHKSWVEQGLLNINHVRINILTHPRYFSITILPKELKDEIAEIYKEYVAWLRSNNAWEHIIRDVEGIVEHMYSADNSDLIPQFIKHVETIDDVRSEKFTETYPEFKSLWK